MADIRLSKIIRQFNIGLDILVDFLHRQGVEVEANPNAKVSDELLPAIGKQFGKDLELKQAADKVDVKITEIIEKNNKSAAATSRRRKNPSTRPSSRATPSSIRRRSRWRNLSRKSLQRPFSPNRSPLTRSPEAHEQECPC